MQQLYIFADIDFINSPWVVGVGTTVLGVVLGLVVNVLAKRFLPKKDSKQYLQDVRSANQEVLGTLRGSIAESAIPSRSIVEALIRATAQARGVKQESLMSVSELSDNLIKDVMDSNFIPYQQKLAYCKDISSFSAEPKQRSKSIQSTTHTNIAYISRFEKEVRDQSINSFSIYVAFITAIVGIMAVAFYSDDKNYTFFGGLSEALSPLLATFVGTAVAGALTYILWNRLKTLVRRRNKNKKTK